MAFRILGNPIISDQRVLVGVNTAGINTALYVGNDIEMDGASGIATIAGLTLGASGGTVFDRVSTDLDTENLSTDLASAAAIVTYVTDSVGQAGTLDFVDKDGNEGAVNIGAGNFFGILGTNNQVDAVVSAGTTQITFSLPSEVIAPGSVEATDYVQVGAGLTVAGSFRFDAGQEVDTIVTSLSSGSLDTELPTAAAVFAAIGSSITGNIDATNVSASSSITAGDGLYVTGHSELDSLNVSGLSTFTGTAEFNGLVQLDLGADLTAGQALGIQTNDGTLQSITHVGVNTGLIETGSASDNVLPTERAVKLYVDSQVGDSATLDITGDTGTGAVNIGGGEFLGIIGTPNEIETVGLGTQITIGLPDDVTITDSLTASGQLVANGAGIGLTVANNAYVSGALEVDGAATLNGLATAEAGVIVNGANLTLGANVDLVGDGSTSEISGITTANLGAGVVATNFYGSGEFLTDVTSGDITLADESTSASDFYIPFAANATGDEALLTDASDLFFRPSDGQLSARNLNNLSDSRYKENVQDIENGLEKVKSLRGVTYDWKDKDGTSVGVIAQELLAVLPEAVDTTNEERFTVNYNGAIALLIQAVKELSAEVEELKQSK